jgi:hypothetical protein
MRPRQSSHPSGIPYPGWAAASFLWVQRAGSGVLPALPIQRRCRPLPFGDTRCGYRFSPLPGRAVGGQPHGYANEPPGGNFPQVRFLPGAFPLPTEGPAPAGKRRTTAAAHVVRQDEGPTPIPRFSAGARSPRGNPRETAQYAIAFRLPSLRPVFCGVSPPPLRDQDDHARGENDCVTEGGEIEADRPPQSRPASPGSRILPDAQVHAPPRRT